MSSEHDLAAQQIVLANRLSQELYDCGHDIGGMHLLDALAALGLALVVDEDGLAMQAYTKVSERRRR